MKINEFDIYYKINTEETKTRIFGSVFVKNNRSRCKIIYNSKIFELKEYLSEELNDNESQKFKIKLIGFENISDFSYMFDKCTSLIKIGYGKDIERKIGKPLYKSFNDEYSLISEINVYSNSDYDEEPYFLELPGEREEKEEKGLTSLENIFSDCNSLEYIPDIAFFNIKNNKSFYHTFHKCNSLKSLPDISKWKTDNIISMRGMFEGCSSLIFLPDISNWNISNVIDISNMFDNCESLLSLPDISKWDTSKVIEMSGMFYKCRSLLSLPDISKWNINRVSNMSEMFSGCNSLISLSDISKWNTSNVNIMNYMFYKCN